MAEQSDEEKSESPTDKKRRDQREEGMVAFSREVPSVAMLGFFLLFFYFASSWILNQFTETFIFAFNVIKSNAINAPDEVSVPFIAGFMSFFFGKLGILLAPIFIVFLAIGLLSSVIQVGFVFSAKTLVPKLEKLSIIKGFGRIFSLNAVNEFFKTVIKLILIGYIGYLSYLDSVAILTQILNKSVGEILKETFEIIGLFTFRIFLAFIIVAVIDYGFQRWNHEQKLKMTLKEVKDEAKTVEGDPLIKQRIRESQKKMSQARMMQDVPKADVVVTNPTHYAVAILYDRETMNSPQIIAKGSDHVALRIIEIAKESKVSVVRNPTLARGIFSICEVGDEVPEQFFKVMARILAYVYKQKGKKIN